MNREPVKRRRRFLAREVIQTSSMDCGPAALKCLLEGFGIHASYGRLREACQTDLDGTSIDTLEKVAVEMGLEAEQFLLPTDYLLMPEAKAAPSLLVVRLPNGAVHFVVLWSLHGRLVQIMDPATGRRWSTVRELEAELFAHTTAVGEDIFRDFCTSTTTLRVLTRRLEMLGISDCRRRVLGAAQASSVLPMAKLEATARMVDALCASRGLARGRQSARVFESFAERLSDDPLTSAPDEWIVPQMFWTGWPAPVDAGGQRQVFVRGAVLIAVSGRRPGYGSVVSTCSPHDSNRKRKQSVQSVTPEGPSSPELVRALHAPPLKPTKAILRSLGRGRGAVIAVLCAGLAVASLGTVELAVLLRSLLDLDTLLGLREQRAAALVALFTFVLVLIVIEFSIARASQWLGRQLELRLRIAFVQRIPRLKDRYLQSRLPSDMAERCHVAQRL